MNPVVGYRRPRSGSDEENLLDSPAFRRPRLEYHESEKVVTNGTTAKRQLTYGDYTVGWICALSLELAAATEMLDEIHQSLPGEPGDKNIYNLGSIGAHNIVIACLPSGHYGTTNAAVVSSNMDRTFPSINIRLMVGIGGGVPTKADIRLGDVVVGHRVVQYDCGKTVQGGVFQRSSHPVEPPQMLSIAVANLRARHESQETRIPEFVSDMLHRRPNMKRYGYPSLSKDRLFFSTHEHDELMDNCDYCDQSQLVHRPPRPSKAPNIYYGVIASGNQVIKHAGTRDDLASQEDALCFEMEAAGLVNHFQCLVIRGICDYCDSHKNKQWQSYAATVAAAYAKELLTVIDSPKMPGVLSNSTEQLPRHDAQTTPQNIIAQQRESILNSLEFEQIDARRSTIKKAHSQTCKWLLEDETYLNWTNPDHLRQHGGFLWIKGKPGAGKSTLMKFILEKAQKSKQNMDTLNFFFNARGHDLERSTIGMYRSLLLQIFTKFPALQSILDSPRPKEKDNQKEWTLGLLKDLFEQVIERLSDVSVACYIDALDECDEDEIRDMISFFERVGQLAMSTDVKFYVCFSSRHYPHISMREGLGLELVLESQVYHGDDIAKYVDSELKIGHSNLAKEIRNELQIKSSGVFMWVILVVEILNKERDKGRIHTMRQKLQEIPADLNDLFHQILTRGYDNKEDLLLCFQWILFSRRPLTPDELYFAIISQHGIDPPSPDDISGDDIRIFILESSKGLAEVTKSKKPTVQFIHESVKDFLLGGDGLRHVWPNLGTDFKVKSHLRLRDCCFSYMKTDIIAHLGLTRPLQWTSAVQAKDLYQRVTHAFPFLEYSVPQVLFHADEAGKSGIGQYGFVSDFLLERWIEHHNILETRGARWYKLDTRFLYILAEADTPHLIEACPDIQSCFEEGSERYGCPLLAAIVTESFEALKMFRNAMATCAAGEFADKHARYICQDHSKLSKLSRNFTFSPLKQTLLSHLAQYGDAELLDLYLQTKKRTPGLNFGTEVQKLLINAVNNGNEGAVRVFIESGQADLQAQDDFGRTLIEFALTQGNKKIVDLFLQNGQFDPNLRDKNGRTLLFYEFSMDDSETFQHLLEAGADPTLMDMNGRCPLSCASARGNDKIIQILLEINVSLDSRDMDNRTPLSWASSAANNNRAIQLLLKAGANPDSRDNNNQTPLLLASTLANNNKAIQLFLEARADPNSRDNNGRTPLSWASSLANNNRAIQLLLEAGANPDSRDHNGQTPLSWASSLANNNRAIQLLLEAGADPDSRAHNGRTPLSWASSVANDHRAIQLLIEAGADPASRDNNSRTPLSWFCSQGFINPEVIQLLLRG